MKRIIIYICFFIIIITTGLGIHKGHSFLKKNKMSDLALANIEALAQEESGNSKCPDPYDVYDHQLTFVQRTGQFVIDGNMEVNVFGQKIKIGGAKVGATINISYEIGDCSKLSPGNCCPNSRNGEIIIIGYN